MTINFLEQLTVCRGRSTEKVLAPHSSTLAWKFPWMEKPCGLESMGSWRVGHDWTTSLSLFTFHFHALEKAMATHSSVLAWRIPGTGEPGGLLSIGSHRVRHDWSDLAAAAAAAEEDPKLSFIPEKRLKWLDKKVKTRETLPMINVRYFRKRIMKHS